MDKIRVFLIFKKNVQPFYIFFSSKKIFILSILLLCKLPTDYHNFSYCVNESNETIQFKINIKLFITNMVVPETQRITRLFIYTKQLY